MALLIKHTGEVVKVTPADGQHFTLEEMQKYVGGDIEVIAARALIGVKILPADYQIGPQTTMVVNEEGKLHRLPFNEFATRLYAHGDIDDIVGDVMLCEFGTEIV